MADPGWARSLAALALSVAYALMSPGRAAGCDPEPRRAEVLVLLVELVVFGGVDRRQVEMLRKEIENVWAEQGVTIAWTSTPTPASVRVVVDRPVGPLPQAPVEGMWSVAHARVVQGHIVPPIYASVDAAERVVRAANQASSGRGSSGLLLPRVLGRAIAHELAHLLLDTPAHAVGGLLRERFTAAEFVAPDTQQFALDDAQQLTARRHRLLLGARTAQLTASEGASPPLVVTGAPVLVTAPFPESRHCSFVALGRLAARNELTGEAWRSLHGKE